MRDGMQTVEEIMKMKTEDLFKMDDKDILSLVHNLRAMTNKINLTCKGLENIKTLKEKVLRH